MFKILKSFICNLMVISIIGAEVKIPYTNAVELPGEKGFTEQSILNPTRFQMKQGYSLMTSIGNGMNQTTGIYSNYGSYKYSERLKFTTAFHLIQNQNNFNVW